MSALLAVSDLRVEVRGPRGPAAIVKGISFEVPAGRTVALVGQSGSGKSLTALALMGLLPPAGCAAGRARFAQLDLLSLPYRALREIRGKRIGMIFQEPMISLNPTMRIGDQVAETLQLHLRMRRSAALSRASELLHEVGIDSPDRRLRQYPHEFSGGMQQRVMIAMAIACGPELLIADEPTTALDVTIQKQILTLLKEIQQRANMALLLITHDLAIVADLAHEVVVLQDGQIVESGPCAPVLSQPRQEYTRSLMQAALMLEGAA